MSLEFVSPVCHRPHWQAEFLFAVKKHYAVVAAFLSPLNVKSSQWSIPPPGLCFFNGTYYIISTSAAAQKVRQAYIHWTICLPGRKDINWPCSQGESAEKVCFSSGKKIDFNKHLLSQSKQWKHQWLFCVSSRESAMEGKLSSLNFRAYSFLTYLHIWRILTQERYQWRKYITLKNLFQIF